MSGPTPSRRTFAIFTIIAVLAILVFAFAYIEVSASRDDLLTSKRNEAVTLIESMVHGTEASVAANNLLEDLIVSHLRTAAQFLRHRERSDGITRSYLGHIAGRLDISFFAITDGQGAIVDANIPQGRLDTESLAALDSIRDGRYQWYVLPNMEISIPQEGVRHYYALAMKRAESDGVVIAGLSEDVLLEYRQQTGIGSMVQDIARNKDILYVLIQDESGILTASRGISSMSSIESDPFLSSAFLSDSAQTRIMEYDGEMMMEAVQRVDSKAGFYYLARIGLSLENVRSIQQRSMRRVILIGVALVALGGLILGFLFTRRRFSTLREEHERVKTSTDLIMENIADGVVAVDTTGTVTFSNAVANAMLDVRGVHADDEDPLFLRETLETGTPIPYRESDILLENKPRILGVSTTIIRNQVGAIDSVIAIFRDLSEAKRIQEQLRRRERLTALGELAGGVAHEIRNPLNAIGIIAQRLKAEFSPVDDTEEYQKLTSTVRTEVERVNTIIKQFLDFARPPKLQLERIWLHVVVADTLEVISSQARTQNVTVELLVDTHVYILADKNALKQAFLNLCQNALDAMPGGGTLRALVVQRDEFAEIILTDTGSGIPRETQAKMFNLYFSTKPTGTGLGLSIVHQIISEHGGDISVESQPGEGTAFTLRFPIAEEA